MKTINILGSTGVVGRYTVDLILKHKEEFGYKVKSITGHKNYKLLAEQVKLLNPEIVAIGDEKFYEDLKNEIGNSDVKILAGREGVLEAASVPSDWVMSAIVGVAALEPTMLAIKNSKTIALANKESIVCSGKLMLAEAEKHGTTILPVDSEHNAIFQVLEDQNKDKIEKLFITASGGPFLNKPIEFMKDATPKEALKHPNWKLGAKISIDSASMVNKCLEIIEAHYLFDMPIDKIEVLMHPESIIHSLISYTDGAVLAELGTRSMQIPIAYALEYPKRINTDIKRLDLTDIGSLNFLKPDLEKFPVLKTVRELFYNGHEDFIKFNAANEVAVDAFLNSKIKFFDIYKIINTAIEKISIEKVKSISDIVAADLYIKEQVKNIFQL